MNAGSLIDIMSATLERYYARSMEAFLLSPRYCDKHFREKYRTLMRKKDAEKYSVVSTGGICSQCDQVGIVHYLDPMMVSKGTK